jgi:hypothetical protein
MQKRHQAAALQILYLFSRMQQQDEPGPEAGGKARNPNIEIRNKFECQKFKCSKQCRESPCSQGYLKTDCFGHSDFDIVSDFVLRILAPGLPLS